MLLSLFGDVMADRAKRLIDYVYEQMNSLIFSLQHRLSPEYFSRSPKMLTFRNTTLMILNMIKKAVAVEVANFFENFKDLSKKPSRQAFAQARDKISYLAIKDFFDKSCELAITEADEMKTYKGYRLLAVDGTSFFVGSLATQSIQEYFGESTTVDGRAMCRIGGIVDVLDQSIVSASVSGYATGERALAIGQIRELKALDNALYLLDRGYWSPELVKEIIGNGQRFLMRLASNTGNTTVKDGQGNSFTLRRYSFTLPNGDVEILLTNLSTQEISDEELPGLYAKRWGIESKYLELKSRLEIDTFSGQSANSVLQDIYATLYISNLTAFLCSDADEIIEEKISGKSNKYAQKANRSFCISRLRDRFIGICLLTSARQRGSELERFVSDISSNVTYVGKSKPRPRNKRDIKAARQRTSPKSVL